MKLLMRFRLLTTSRVGEPVKMLRTATFCMFLLVLEAAYSAVIRHEQNRRMLPKSFSYVELIGDDDVEIDYEDLQNLPRIDEERLPRDASLVGGNQPSQPISKPQMDRNKPKIIGFNYNARKTTPFPYVDTTLEEQRKYKEVEEIDDESQGGGDDGNEDSEELSEEGNRSNSKKIGSDEGKSSKRKEKEKRKKSSEEDDDDDYENYSDATFGIFNTDNYSIVYIAMEIVVQHLHLNEVYSSNTTAPFCLFVLLFMLFQSMNNDFRQASKTHIQTNHSSPEHHSYSYSSQHSVPQNESDLSAQLFSSDKNAVNDEDQNEEEAKKVAAEEVTLWRRLLKAFKWIAKVCYILCPPVPKLMIRKAAFHPPKHCHYYFLIGGQDDKRQQFFDAKSAKESINLTICLPHLLLPKFKNSDVADQLLRIEVRLITSANGDILVALYVRCEKSYRCKKSAPYILLFAQPNSSDVGSCMLTDPNLVDIADFLQCDLIAFDYSGFGLSTGTPTEKNVYQNMEAVYQYLIEEMKAQPNEIILIGFSMGTAVAIHLASLKKVLLIDSPNEMAHCAPRNLMQENLALTSYSIDKASKVPCRTLICHGMNDVIVSMNHSAVLQSRFPNATKPFYLDKATHQGIYCERKMWDRVQQFLFYELDNNKKWNEPVKTKRAFVDYNF
uniref:AB hydrolase-1 domain-containing protein n=1 Tax=Setaria digitata TaxID=48799 RepID=A0A915PP01_9BILA